MKKLTAFAAVCILITASAFAQFSLGMGVQIGTQLIGGTSDKDEIETASWGKTIWNTTIYGSNELRTFGFWAGVGKTDPGDGQQGVTGCAWLFLTPEIFIAIGDVADSASGSALLIGKGDFTGWSLNSTDNRMQEKDPFWWYNGYPGGLLLEMNGLYMGGNGNNNGFGNDHKMQMQVSLFPLGWFGVFTANKLSLNFFFPTIKDDTVKGAYLDHFEGQAVYDWHGVGQAAISYRNSMRVAGADGAVGEYYEKSKGVFLQWKQPLRDMKLEAGVAFGIQPFEGEFTGRWPIRLGVGWVKGNFWNGDPVVYSARLGASIPMEDYHDPIIGLEFVFNYMIKRGLRIYVYPGIGLIFGEEVGVAWQFSPYIVWDLGGPQFHAGLRLRNGDLGPGWPPLGPNAPHNGEFYGGLNKDNQSVIRWAIPIFLQWGWAGKF
ncbi:MAG: hypothetical protein LBG95_02985 [Treponema sp.]|jgi:hypothetical protein|nr:hypothetical protein [Treponema sp.]